MPETPDIGTLEVTAPPPVPTFWERAAEALRQTPGQWRRLTGLPTETVATTNITRGVLAAFRPAGSFEAVRRDGDLFVIYLGDPAELNAAVDRLLEGEQRCPARQGDNSPTHRRCVLDTPHPGQRHKWRR